MTSKTQSVDKSRQYNKTYNKKGREPLFRVEISTADPPEVADNMRQMKVDLIEKSGTAKKGVVEMYDFAKQNGYFDE